DGALPPLEVSGQVWNLPLVRPYSLGEAQMYMVEIRQAWPAAGLLDARARASTEDARAMLADLATREQDVIARVDHAYADYVRGTLDHRVHREHLDLLIEMHD